ASIDMAAQHPESIPFAVFKPTGLASIDLLSKKESGQALSAEENAAYERVRLRFESVCAHAAALQVRIMVDAEESWIQNTVDALVTELMERFNQTRAIVFNTIQFYRHDRLEFLKRSLQKAEEKGYNLGFKIVRGAYMEKERKRATELGLISPINPTKAASDEAYDAAIHFCLEHIDRIAICAGTHNEASVQLLIKLMQEAKLSPQDPRLHFAQLLGMSDNISFNLAAAGYNVAKYMPYGTVAELLPYLSRRAQENSSVLGQSNRELDFLLSEIKRRKLER
ncbi:MAG: proline dehydrogenase family protein, partial [Proteobacteria bacterium]|nr:proline dehydrogenase family protein [Pseudomonadota bacterium]